MKYYVSEKIMSAVCGQIFFSLQTRSITSTGTPPLTRFFGPGKNRVKGKPRYRRSILVLKPQNGEFDNPKSTFPKFLLLLKIIWL